MNLQTERKTVRFALILSIVSGTSLLSWSFLDSDVTPGYDALGTEIVFSGFGEIKLYNPQKIDLFSTNTYQDKILGFQISKPKGNWEIHSAIDELSPEKLSILESKGFVDGLFVEQDHDQRFMLTVFYLQKENFSLHEFVDNQIELMESHEWILSSEQVSPKDDWAIFAMKSADEDEYGEQMMFLNENQLYILQYSGLSPHLLDSEKKKEFQYIMESFEVI